MAISQNQSAPHVGARGAKDGAACGSRQYRQDERRPGATGRGSGTGSNAPRARSRRYNGSPALTVTRGNSIIF
jgi:hypothetical protein